MALDELQLHVHPGDGVVANFGSAVVVAFADDAAQEAVVDDVLGIVEAGLAEHGPTPERRVARRLARLLSQPETDDAPPFCVVAQVDTGVAVLLHGSVDLQVTRQDGDETVSGTQVATWVDRIVDDDFERVSVARSGQPFPAPDPRSDLRLGTVRGGAAVLAPRSRAAAPTAPPAARREAAAPPPPPPPPPTTSAPSTSAAAPSITCARGRRGGRARRAGARRRPALRAGRGLRDRPGTRG